MNGEFSSIVPIILAAGDSTRMGYPKALLPLGTDIFLTRILRTVQKSGLPAPTIVLGKAAGVIEPRIRNWRAAVYVNPDPGRGQMSSIKIGLSHLTPDCCAFMIWPVDHPAVSNHLIMGLARLFINSPAQIVLPVFGERRGHPAIFDRILLRELMDARLEESPKKILLRHKDGTAVLPTDEPGAVQDIDTPEDYQSLTGETLESALARGSDER